MKTYVVLCTVICGFMQLYAVGGTDEGTNYTDWISFCIANEDRIASGKYVEEYENRIASGKDVEEWMMSEGQTWAPSELRGLDLDDTSLQRCARWGRVLTNVVSLRIMSHSREPLPAVVFAATNFARLEYLHLEIRRAAKVGASIKALSKLHNLRYLGVDAPSATNIDTGIYGIDTLHELLFVVGTNALPDGISRLPELTRLAIYAHRVNPVTRLPKDLVQCRLQTLDVMMIHHIEELLPTLPHGLINLSVAGCGLQAFPHGWLKQHKLQVVNLSNNMLTEFPIDLLDLASLKYLNLDLNLIRNIPRLEIPTDRNITIHVVGNPIQRFAPENMSLVRRGVIVK